jgi:hypothetical protein
MLKPIIRVYLKMIAQKGRQKAMLRNTERKQVTRRKIEGKTQMN